MAENDKTSKEPASLAAKVLDRLCKIWAGLLLLSNSHSRQNSSKEESPMGGGLTRLPDADHVEGIALTKGPTPQTSQIEIQYRSARTGWCKVEMSLPNALYLLTLLEGMSLDHGYEKLRKGEK